MMKEYVLSIILIAVRGPYSAPTYQVIKTFNAARQQIRVETHARLDMARLVKLRRNRWQRFMRVESRGVLLYKLRSYYLSHGFGARIGLVSLPPFVEPTGLWMAGMASRVCHPNGGLAWATTEVKNSLGEPRLEQSRIAMAHELGHLIGADHFPGFDSIMDTGALGLNPSELRFKDISRYQITGCLWKKW